MTFRQAKSRLRTLVAMQLKKRRWLIPAVAILGFAATSVAVLIPAEKGLTLLAAIWLFATAYLWGFSAHAFRSPRWPPTGHFHRREYAAVWDTLANSAEMGAVVASGKRYEEDVRESAAPTIRNLNEFVGVGAQDDVLEIGCGVGRIGRELAPHCRSWTGSDISKNMLTYATERLAHLNNVRLQQLHGGGLGEFTDGSFDVVYCTNMLAHLDEIDRWRYVQEAFRVLRSEGRLFLDSIDIESDEGWAAFVGGPSPDLESERPPFMPRASTVAELENYAKRAGFGQIQSHRRPPLVIMTARK